MNNDSSIIMVIYVSAFVTAFIWYFRQKAKQQKTLPLRQQAGKAAQTPTFVCYEIQNVAGDKSTDAIQLLGDQHVGTLKPGMRLNSQGVTVTVVEVYGDEENPDSLAPAKPGVLDNAVIIECDEQAEEAIRRRLQEEYIISFEVWEYRL